MPCLVDQLLVREDCPQPRRRHLIVSTLIRENSFRLIPRIPHWSFSRWRQSQKRTDAANVEFATQPPLPTHHNFNHSGRMSKVTTHKTGVVRKPLADRTNVATTRRGVQTKLNVAGESRKKAPVADGTIKMKAASTTSSSRKATTSLKTTKVTSSKTRTQAKVAAGQASSAQSTPEHAWTVSDFEVGRPLYVLRCNPSFLPFAHPKFSIVRFTLKRAGQIRYVTHRRSSSKADCCLCYSSWLRRSSVPGQGEEVRLRGGHQGALQA